MRAVAYTLTLLSALLAVTALMAVLLFGATHQLLIAVMAGIMTVMGVSSIREEEREHGR